MLTKIMINGKDTYELWYLGDYFTSRVKRRESYNELLFAASELIRCGREHGLTVGGVEILHCRGSHVKTVWDYNFAEGK